MKSYADEVRKQRNESLSMSPRGDKRYYKSSQGIDNTLGTISDRWENRTDDMAKMPSFYLL